jgi:hypothetical protein
VSLTTLSFDSNRTRTGLQGVKCENLLAVWQPRVFYAVISKTWFFCSYLGGSA